MMTKIPVQGLVKISFCASTSLQEELIAYIDGSDMINFLSVKWIQSKFLRSICLNFQIADITANISISPLKGGLINDTYRVSVDTSSSYVLQRVNTNVFRDYDKLMQNISTVLDHIQLKSKGSIAHILVLIPTLSGEFYWSRSAKNDAVEVWRMYNYIPNSVTYPVATNLDILYEAGKAYGRFQCCVQDILPFSLYETIPDFHNTPKRLEALRKAFSEDICHRADDVQEEIEFIERNSWLAYSIVNLLDDGTLPKRIIHNDTKLENVLFDKYSNHALCVIDYDTVMPNGSMLYDFGDATRSMASSSSEDEQDLTKVRFEINRYKYFTEGFLREVITIITEHEITMLPMGAIVITLEQAIRFLTDYLVGDVYFKVAFSEHNLVRTKNQLKLVKEMLEKKEYMEEIISNYCRNFDNKKSEI
jgi:Ser/Thr protein kinase RdoA (MazF antagonist)